MENKYIEELYYVIETFPTSHFVVSGYSDDNFIGKKIHKYLFFSRKEANKLVKRRKEFNKDKAYPKRRSYSVRKLNWEQLSNLVEEARLYKENDQYGISLKLNYEWAKSLKCSDLTDVSEMLIVNTFNSENVVLFNFEGSLTISGSDDLIVPKEIPNNLRSLLFAKRRCYRLRNLE